MGAHIVILTGSPLCHNPRVMKEAGSLANAGYDVEVLGGWIDRSLKERDRGLMASSAFRFTPVFDLTDRTTGTLVRTRRKLGIWVHQAGHENRWQLGYAYPDIYRQAARRDAALFIAHSEPAMAAAVRLLKDGRCVGVDMEDWFSEDLLPETRRYRPLKLIRSLEAELLRGGSFASCPSKCMSLALADAYGCHAPITVYNAFEWAERRLIDGLRKDRRDFGIPSVHWFSQTVGPGRGIEDLILALPMIRHPFEIHLRGNLVPGFSEWISNHAPAEWRDRIFISCVVSNHELLSRIAEHDIGFAGEMTFCRSRDLTVTNKILYYLLAGTAVIASDTTGQREVAGLVPGGINLYPPGDSVALANRLNDLLKAPVSLHRAKARALEAAERMFCWELQETALLDAVARAIGSARGK